MFVLRSNIYFRPSQNIPVILILSHATPNSSRTR